MIAIQSLVSVSVSNSILAWSLFLERMEEGAKRFRSKHNKIPVLIIDHINKLTRASSGSEGETLFMLQDWAKTMSDRKLFHVIFVSSTGRALGLMKSNLLLIIFDCHPL